MSVHVTVMPSAVPHYLRDQDSSREKNFNDREDTEFVFEILPSGALVIWKGKPGSDVGSDVEIAYGPTAWDNVQGTPRRSTL